MNGDGSLVRVMELPTVAGLGSRAVALESWVNRPPVSCSCFGRGWSVLPTLDIGCLVLGVSLVSTDSSLVCDRNPNFACNLFSLSPF